MGGVPAPVRVLVVTHTAELGGAESALLRLLRVTDPGTFEVEGVVLEAGPLVERLRSTGAEVHELRAGDVTRVTRTATVGSAGAVLRNGRDAARVAARLRRLIRRRRPDLVVANSLKSAVMVSLAAPAARTPWVWHLHDRVAEDYLPGPVATALRALARLGPRRVVVNSHATAATLGAGAQRKVVVAYPGLAAEAFDAPAGGRQGGPVGIVGRVSSTKGQREFLAAAETVGRQRPDVSFRVVGAALFEDAVVEEELRAATAASSVADRVAWTGWVDDPAGQLRDLSLLVHASPVPEPFGQVVTEAMAAGVPVVATEAGGVPEILDPDGSAQGVADGVRRSATGLLVRPGDADALARAIVWALDHPEVCRDAAARARDDARRRFGIEVTRDAVARAWTAAVRPG
ncbi:glycosyltransferase family 4 protein [Actinotalea caeni]|uniref:glycosyltransferase family 4 protein n=1 Tax=Actinotalea caeni TaxID=1348467 RepID=UPI0012E14EEE|nr:glycosyltransferase family 4 protein [Actinotalea caeni]